MDSSVEATPVGKRILAAAPRDEHEHGTLEHEHGTPRSGSKVFSARKVALPVTTFASAAVVRRYSCGSLPPSDEARARAFALGIQSVNLLCLCVLTDPCTRDSRRPAAMARPQICKSGSHRSKTRWTSCP